jgi:hypothetical protein
MGMPGMPCTLISFAQILQEGLFYVKKTKRVCESKRADHPMLIVNEKS